MFAHGLYFAFHHHLFALQKSRSCNPKEPLLHGKTYCFALQKRLFYFSTPIFLPSFSLFSPFRLC
ncbi:hypothetical protein D2S45_06775 [Prevotella intermedia]|uniref:Uncharacterized protein n=1 Tax=Prevotella intermedia TaxID=28131 RepID=A0A425VP53_PREIN|nr:hypothetical protein D2S53_06535 [Prevotella intermedia]RRF87347.1 hypothetical protein D2S45_06775 [Prevotella intermedia]